MKRFVILLVVVALGLVAADVSVATGAAVVNGTTISQASLNTQLSEAAGSPQFQCYLEVTATAENGAVKGQLRTVTVTGSGGSGTYASSFAAQTLTRMVDAQLISQVARAHHAVVTAADRTLARQELDQGYDTDRQDLTSSQVALPAQCEQTSPSLSASVPAALADQEIASIATDQALEGTLAGPGLTPAGEQQFYDAHRSTYRTFCVQGFTATTKALAGSLRATLGTPAGLAAATSAQGSAAQEACYTPQSTQVSQQDEDDYEVVSSHAAGLRPGQSAAPFSNGTDYVVLYLNGIKDNSLASVRSEVIATILGAGLTPTKNAVAAAALKRAQVTLDPRYGHWSAQAGVVAAGAPATPLVLNPGADTPPPPPPAEVPVGTGSGSVPAGSGSGSVPAGTTPTTTTPSPSGGTSNGG